MVATATEDRHATRGRRAAASAALDVMLTDAALDDGGVRRFIKPPLAVKLGTALARHPQRVAGRLGWSRRRARTRRRRTLTSSSRRRATGASATPRWRDNWLLRRVLQSYLATVAACDGLIDDARPRLAHRAPGALRGRQRAGRARADELPVVKPSGAPRDGRQGWREPRGGRSPLCARHVKGAAPAGERRHEQVRARREPRVCRRDRWCCARRSSS